VDAVANRIFLGPILDGNYPADLISDAGPVTDWNFVRDGDLEAIHQRPDILGINYYTPSLVAALDPETRKRLTKRWVNDPQGSAEPSRWPGSDRAYSLSQNGPYTAMGWPIEPDSFAELLLRVGREHPGLPLMVTENGAAFADAVGADGVVHDHDRIAYLAGHLDAVRRAIEAGVDVRGYFVWSLLDNFEWAWGYSKRFGIVHVDYDTLERTPKDSARWYRDVIRANRLPA
jgi:beta-glucosidase